MMLFDASNTCTHAWVLLPGAVPPGCDSVNVSFAAPTFTVHEPYTASTLLIAPPRPTFRPPRTWMRYRCACEVPADACPAWTCSRYTRPPVGCATTRSDDASSPTSCPGPLGYGIWTMLMVEWANVSTSPAERTPLSADGFAACANTVT